MVILMKISLEITMMKIDTDFNIKPDNFYHKIAKGLTLQIKKKNTKNVLILKLLQELSYLPCALPYRFIFSSETDYITLGKPEKAGAIFWVMVG